MKNVIMIIKFKVLISRIKFEQNKLLIVRSRIDRQTFEDHENNLIITIRYC